MEAKSLINGVTILQIETDMVEYWHVELAEHSILLAENLPAESYLDNGNHTGFINGGAFIEAHPDFQPKYWSDTCAKLVFDGPEMQDAKATILARALALGYKLRQEDGSNVIADGKRVAIELGDFHHALLVPVAA